MHKTSLKIPEDLYHKIKTRADSQAVTVSEFIRTTVSAALEDPVVQQQDPVLPKEDQSEIKFLREQVDRFTSQLDDANRRQEETQRAAEEASKRHDTIVLKMTTQLDRTTLQLEDLRNQQRQSWWGRLFGSKGKANGSFQKPSHIHAGTFEQKSEGV